MERIEPVIEEVGKISKGTVFPLIFDVRDPKAIQTAIDAIPADLQNIDILVNNAGLAQELHTIDEGDFEDWDNMIDSNIKGILYVTRIISPQMKIRKSGHIINIGSIASHEIYLGGSVYCASKHAVWALTKGMRTDFLEHHIRVTQVSPGAAETQFSITRFHGNKERAAQVYTGYHALSAEDIAEIVEFAITRPEHVCLNEIIVTPTAQFNGRIWKQ
jgi:NADP-dependent 3-hydroxy acid dehydrogenase YdfG